MKKLIGFKKKITSKMPGGVSGNRTSRSVGSQAIRSKGRARRRRGVLGFIRRNFKLVCIAGGIVLIAVLCIVIFAGGPDTAVTAPPKDEEGTPTQTEGYDYQNYDSDVLAGLTGSDDDLFSGGPNSEESLLEQEGIRIGVTVGNLATAEDEAVINRLEDVWNASKSAKEIYNVFYYNASGNANQQLQDFRSLVNNEVDVIITAFTGDESYNTLVMMASKAGIPVIAYQAPVNSGYTINVLPDQEAWGNAYGKFMAEKLVSGNVLLVMSGQDNQGAAARSAAAQAAMSGNTQISLLDTIHGDAGTAKAAVATLLAEGKPIDGVIVDEGLGQSVLDAFIEARKLPRVMCGDATAGFIKKWNSLKHGGVNVTPKAIKNQPEPTPEFFAAQPNEFVVCVQPSPTGGAAAAFEIAVELAKGRKLISEGQTITYTVKTLITDENLATYYEQVKELEDEAAVKEYMAESMLDSLLHPLEQ